MAEVELAARRGPGGFSKLVVLKRLRSDDASLREMFLEEARLAALLHHPNVVQTYEISEVDGSYFIAMEYLEGQSLEKIIRETQKLGEPLAASFCARVVADALCGLHYAHELCDYAGTPLQMVHRDISPHNLVLTYEGNVKLLDFGVAKTAHGRDFTLPGVLKGKLAYMAPEQAAGEPLDRRADVFSMGVVLWELLTLRRLRTADSATSLLHEALQARAPDLSQVRPDVDRRLEVLLWCALARDPARRFRTAQEMRDALLEYLALNPCSQEQVAKLMHARFGPLREALQRKINACLERAEARDVTLVITGSQADSGELTGRSLPLLDSGSLPLGRELAVTGLARSELVGDLGPRASSPSARSRSLRFSEEADASASGRFLGPVLSCGVLLAALGSASFLRHPEPTPPAPPLPASVPTRAPPAALARLQHDRSGARAAPRGGLSQRPRLCERRAQRLRRATPRDRPRFHAAARSPISKSRRSGRPPRSPIWPAAAATSA
jgi:serine/threonine protein kinase